MDGKFEIKPKGYKSPVSGFVAGVAATLIIGTTWLIALPCTCSPHGAALPNSDRTIDDSANGNATVVNLLEPIRRKYEVPAICAAVVNSEGVIAVGAVGVRKRSTAVCVTVNDLWHLGSETKAMTAALIGRLVECGKLRWDSTLEELFAELSCRMRPEMKTVTILQLLSHRAGLEANYDWHQLSQMNTLWEQRYAVVQKAVTDPPRHPPGSAGHYSNVGYVLAGAAVEKVTGRPWEEQMVSLLFEPLGMTSAGFGGTGTPGQLDQPWGHDENGRPVALNGPAADNPPILGPAGRVHCTLTDWAAFVIDQLRGALGQPALLNPQTYQRIQSPPFGDDFALGWLAVNRDWGGGTVLNHTGSNTMNYANVWIAPKRDLAVLVCVNQGGQAGFKASDEAVGVLIDTFLQDPNEPQQDIANSN